MKPTALPWAYNSTNLHTVTDFRHSRWLPDFRFAGWSRLTPSNPPTEHYLTDAAPLQTVAIFAPLPLGVNQLCGPRSSFLNTNVSFSDNQ